MSNLNNLLDHLLAADPLALDQVTVTLHTGEPGDQPSYRRTRPDRTIHRSYWSERSGGTNYEHIELGTVDVVLIPERDGIALVPVNRDGANHDH